jgi:hypothetical protein
VLFPYTLIRWPANEAPPSETLLASVVSVAVLIVNDFAVGKFDGNRTDRIVALPIGAAGLAAAGTVPNNFALEPNPIDLRASSLNANAAD